MRHLTNLADIVFRPKFDESAPTKEAKRAARKANVKRRKQWKDMMDPYIKFWTLLNTKERDLTDAEIDKAHVLGNKFFGIYVDMFPDRECP